MDWLITRAEIKTAGAAEAVLSAGHVKRSRYAHQVNASALFILIRDTWKTPEIENFDICINEMRKISTPFNYWNIALELECIYKST